MITLIIYIVFSVLVSFGITLQSILSERLLWISYFILFFIHIVCWPMYLGAIMSKRL